MDMYRLGILEVLQPRWALDLSAGIRFTLVTIAVMALWFTVSEIYSILRKKRVPSTDKVTPQTYALFFVNRLLVVLAVIFQLPAAAYRLGLGLYINPHLAYALLIIGNVLLIIYLLVTETLRLAFADGITLREAIKRSWAFVAGAAVLGLTYAIVGP